jgi:hypothetical protein
MRKNENLIVWARNGSQLLVGFRCGECGGMARYFDPAVENDDCPHCHGLGWFGIDPRLPVSAPQGTVAKVAMLSVRYASGLPLWNPQDAPASSADAPPDGSGRGPFSESLSNEAGSAAVDEEGSEVDAGSYSLAP